MLLDKEGWSSDAASALVETLASDYRLATLAGADRVMLDYAMKLTERPADIDASDIDALRQVGFGDRAIHDICAITAYYAFVNRIADGLGVKLEPRLSGQ